MIGIYKITSPSNRVYIGQSINIEKRVRHYKRLDCKEQSALYNSLLKHGFENHKFEILCECSIEELNEKERFYQDLYNVLKSGLNCRLTKASDRSGFMSENTKIKMSLVGKQRVFSKETRLKMSISKKGIPMSKAQKQKLREINLGKKQSKEAIEKTRLANIGNKHCLGKVHSEKTKLKMSLVAKNRKHTDETKLKLSQIKKGKKLSIENRERLSKLILNLETGIFYFGVAFASETINMKCNTLKCKLNGQNKNDTSFIYV